MSYRITEAARKFVATIDDTTFELEKIVSPTDVPETFITLSDGDKLNEKIKLPKLNFRWDADDDKGAVLHLYDMDKPESEIVCDGVNHKGIGWRYFLRLNKRNGYGASIQLTRENDGKAWIIPFETFQDITIKSVIIDETLKVTGDTNLNGNTYANAALTVSGVSTFDSVVSFKDDITVNTEATSTFNGPIVTNNIATISGLVVPNDAQINNIIGQTAVFNDYVSLRSVNNDISGVHINHGIIDLAEITYARRINSANIVRENVTTSNMGQATASGLTVLGSADIAMLNVPYISGAVARIDSLTSYNITTENVKSKDIKTNTETVSGLISAGEIVSEKSTLNNNTQVNGILNISGSTTIKGDLKVTGSQEFDNIKATSGVITDLSVTNEIVSDSQIRNLNVSGLVSEQSALTGVDITNAKITNAEITTLEVKNGSVKLDTNTVFEAFGGIKTTEIHLPDGNNLISVDGSIHVGNPGEALVLESSQPDGIEDTDDRYNHIKLLISGQEDKYLANLDDIQKINGSGYVDRVSDQVINGKKTFVQPVYTSSIYVNDIDTNPETNSGLQDVKRDYHVITREVDPNDPFIAYEDTFVPNEFPANYNSGISYSGISGQLFAYDNALSGYSYLRKQYYAAYTASGAATTSSGLLSEAIFREEEAAAAFNTSSDFYWNHIPATDGISGQLFIAEENLTNAINAYDNFSGVQLQVIRVAFEDAQTASNNAGIAYTTAQEAYEEAQTQLNEVRTSLTHEVQNIIKYNRDLSLLASALDGISQYLANDTTSNFVFFEDLESVDDLAIDCPVTGIPIAITTIKNKQEEVKGLIDDSQRRINLIEGLNGSLSLATLEVQKTKSEFTNAEDARNNANTALESARTAYDIAESDLNNYYNALLAAQEERNSKNDESIVALQNISTLEGNKDHAIDDHTKAQNNYDALITAYGPLYDAYQAQLVIYQNLHAEYVRKNWNSQSDLTDLGNLNPAPYLPSNFNEIKSPVKPYKYNEFIAGIIAEKIINPALDKVVLVGNDYDELKFRSDSLENKNGTGKGDEHIQATIGGINHLMANADDIIRKDFASGTYNKIVGDVITTYDDTVSGIEVMSYKNAVVSGYSGMIIGEEEPRTTSGRLFKLSTGDNSIINISGVGDDEYQLVTPILSNSGIVADVKLVPSEELISGVSGMNLEVTMIKDGQLVQPKYPLTANSDIHREFGPASGWKDFDLFFSGYEIHAGPLSGIFPSHQESLPLWDADDPISGFVELYNNYTASQVNERYLASVNGVKALWQHEAGIRDAADKELTRRLPESPKYTGRFTLTADVRTGGPGGISSTYSWEGGSILPAPTPDGAAIDPPDDKWKDDKYLADGEYGLKVRVVTLQQGDEGYTDNNTVRPEERKTNKRFQYIWAKIEE